MKHILTIFLLLLNFLLFGQDEQIKKELKELLHTQIEYLHKGEIKKYYQFYDKKTYVHLHGGRNKDGKVNFRKEIKRMKKGVKKMRKKNIDYQNETAHYKEGIAEYQKEIKLSIDSLLDFDNIIILNFKEFQKENESLDSYGFVMKEGDYFVFLYPKRKSYLAGAWHGGIYRNIKGKWKIVGGDL